MVLMDMMNYVYNESVENGSFFAIHSTYVSVFYCEAKTDKMQRFE